MRFLSIIIICLFALNAHSITVTEKMQNALSYMMEKEYEKSKLLLSSFIKDHPTDPLSGTAHFWLGKIYQYEKNYRAAAIFFGEGVQKFPKSIKAAEMFYELSKALFAMNKDKEACKSLTLLFERYPGSIMGSKGKESYNQNCNASTKIAQLPKKQYEVITSTLNGRSKPSTNSKIIKKFYLGDVVTVTGSNNNWYQVLDTDTNTSLYVASEYLRSFKLDGQERVIAFASSDLEKIKNKIAENKLQQTNKTTTEAKKTSTVSIQEEEDTDGPIIDTPLTITANDMEAIISGTVKDNSTIVRVLIDNDPVSIVNNQFTKNLFIPDDNYTVQIEATDKHGNSSRVEVSISQGVSERIIQLAKLNPLSIKGPKNKNAIAIIIGVEKYKDSVPDAQYAANDAKMFKGFANKVLGVPIDKIKVLTNEEANLLDTKVVFEGWLPGRMKDNESDIYLFYSGHGLANIKDNDLYLLPYDGKPDYLNLSSLKRNEIFQNINKYNPKSVTVFLDTCYSGQTRDEEVLLASAKPIVLDVEEEDIPTNFTVFTASANNQIASSFKEAGHGLFSYYMMQGLEGKADTNNDQKITANELFVYLSTNVSKKAQSIGRIQQPQLLGSSEQVIVQW